MADWVYNNITVIGKKKKDIKKFLDVLQQKDNYLDRYNDMSYDYTGLQLIDKIVSEIYEQCENEDEFNSYKETIDKLTSLSGKVSYYDIISKLPDNKIPDDKEDILNYIPFVVDKINEINSKKKYVDDDINLCRLFYPSHPLNSYRFYQTKNPTSNLDCLDSNYGWIDKTFSSYRSFISKNEIDCIEIEKCITKKDKLRFYIRFTCESAWDSIQNFIKAISKIFYNLKFEVEHEFNYESCGKFVIKNGKVKKDVAVVYRNELDYRIGEYEETYLIAINELLCSYDKEDIDVMIEESEMLSDREREIARYKFLNKTINIEMKRI